MTTPRTRWLVTAAGALTALVLNLDQATILLAIPTIADALDANLSQTQWILSGFLLPLAALVILGGSLADRFAPVRILQVGLVTFAAGSVVSALASEVAILTGARVVAGSGAALAFPSSIAILYRSLDGPELTVALGAWFSGALTGSAVGPVIGGLLLRTWPWESVLWMSAGLTLAALVLVTLFVPSERQRSAVPLWLGPNAVVAVAMALTVWGLIEAGSDGWGSTRALGPVVAGALILSGVAVAGLPRLDQPPEATRLVAGGLAMMMLAILSVVGTVFFVITFMQNVLGYSPLRAGFALLPFGATAAVLAPMGARLIRRQGRVPLVLTAIGFETVGLIGLSRITPTSTYIGIGIFLSLLGAAMAIFPAVSLDLALSHAPVDRGGVVSGAHAAALQFGQLISIATMGSLVSSWVGGIYRSKLEGAGLPTEVPGDLVEDLGRGLSAAPSTASLRESLRYEAIGEIAFTTAVGRTVIFMLGLTAFASIVGVALLKSPLRSSGIRAGGSI